MTLTAAIIVGTVLFATFLSAALAWLDDQENDS